VGKVPGLSNLVRVAWRLADLLGFTAFPDQIDQDYDTLISMVPTSRPWWFDDGFAAVKERLEEHLSAMPQ
jgi:hypothetical protein